MYMKRIVIGLTSKAMVTTEEMANTYVTWLKASYVSYTLGRWAQYLVRKINGQIFVWYGI